MENLPNPTTTPKTGTSDAFPAPSARAGDHLTTLSSLLSNLEDTPVRHPIAPSPRTLTLDDENQLVQVRLGIASSLFAALKARHSPTASHSLRVALGCSSWGLLLNLNQHECDELEVAALLHDIGKIGLPDHVLLKPGQLTAEEEATVARRRDFSQQILLSCCASQQVLNIVKYAPAWYDGSKPGFDRRFKELPFGARMVAILDAFDSMTTNQVYRRAMSQERAMAELYEFAGTQFDAPLVAQFCDLLASDQIKLTSKMARRWLEELTSERSNAFWRLAISNGSDEGMTIDRLFHQKLLDSMHDGVIFVDTNMHVVLWNRAAERLTGLPSSSVLHQQWSPSLLGLRDENNSTVRIENCPMTRALSTKVQTLRRLTVHGRGNERISVDAHTVPVTGRDGVMYGATLLLHDASSEITLEERVQTLHEKAIRDPLTKVANRAEFDRVHAQFVETHLERRLPCALIICDIDHFKNVNDTFGHQAGDDALINFAALLQRSARPGDLVARYGGEEFVMLCADCSNAAITERAELIRGELAETHQAALNDEPITASFGVTEIQAGDTPETMLRRADRALMMAKQTGRNRVVQLGSGIPHDTNEKQRISRRRWFQPSPPSKLLDETLVTAVPLAITMEKLRGFISDHHAEIAATEEDKLLLLITKKPPVDRRTNDRPMSFLLSLQFIQQPTDSTPANKASNTRTIIRVTIRLFKNRDRRRGDAGERARQLFASLRSYFMAHKFAGEIDDLEQLAQPGLLTRILRTLRLGGRHDLV